MSCHTILCFEGRLSIESLVGWDLACSRLDLCVCVFSFGGVTVGFVLNRVQGFRLQVLVFANSSSIVLHYHYDHYDHYCRLLSWL